MFHLKHEHLDETPYYKAAYHTNLLNSWESSAALRGRFALSVLTSIVYAAMLHIFGDAHQKNFAKTHFYSARKSFLAIWNPKEGYDKVHLFAIRKSILKKTTGDQLGLNQLNLGSKRKFLDWLPKVYNPHFSDLKCDELVLKALLSLGGLDELGSDLASQQGQLIRTILEAYPKENQRLFVCPGEKKDVVTLESHQVDQFVYLMHPLLEFSGDLHRSPLSEIKDKAKIKTILSSAEEKRSLHLLCRCSCFAEDELTAQELMNVLLMNRLTDYPAARDLFDSILKSWPQIVPSNRVVDILQQTEDPYLLLQMTLLASGEAAKTHLLRLEELEADKLDGLELLCLKVGLKHNHRSIRNKALDRILWWLDSKKLSSFFSEERDLLARVAEDLEIPWIEQHGVEWLKTAHVQEKLAIALHRRIKQHLPPQAYWIRMGERFKDKDMTQRGCAATLISPVKGTLSKITASERRQLAKTLLQDPSIKVSPNSKKWAKKNPHEELAKIISFKEAEAKTAAQFQK